MTHPISDLNNHDTKKKITCMAEYLEPEVEFYEEAYSDIGDNSDDLAWVDCYY